MAKPAFEHFKRAALEVAKHGDNDTLPFDMDVRFCGDKAQELATVAHGFYSELEALELDKCRERMNALKVYTERLIAPSGPAGFRVVTKIHPFWNVFLNGLAIAIAEDFEPQRFPAAHSYRFLSDGGENLFDPARSWRAFKEATVAHATAAGEDAVIVQTDISSFYEHISHHHIENLIAGLTGNEHIAKQINALLSKVFAGRSFGLPVGGQAARIFAELILHEVDRKLSWHGIQWHRYVDDYVLIATDNSSAYRALGALGHALMDYGLSLNKSKTVILSSKHYQDYVRAQLGGDDEEAAKLRSIDLRFDPYSDNPDEEYESLKETVDTLEVRQLLNRELEKALPDSFLVTQIGRTMPLHEPVAALEIAATLLSRENLHSFRASFSTIMRGIANLRREDRFASIHDGIDRLLDEVPKHSEHLLQLDTNLLHYLRTVRFRRTTSRESFVAKLFESTRLETVRRACIACWRTWADQTAFNQLRNRWPELRSESQREYWFASFAFGGEGAKARTLVRREALQMWSLGVEVQGIDNISIEMRKAIPRGQEPLFSQVFIDWAKDANGAS